MLFRKTSLLICLLAFCLVLPAAAQLDVSPPPSIELDAPGGQMRVIPIIITNPEAEPIDAYSLTLTYPTNLLTFIETDSLGTATENWTQSFGQENTSGVITIGGYNTTGGFTQSDTIINVVFFDTGVQGGPETIALSNFDDDIANASTTDGILNSSVPVELVTFAATVSQGQVELNWTTSTETNNLGFEVQKSFDQTKFSKIGFVEGQGTTVQPRSYSFLDGNLDTEKQVRYYRLKQIDLNGSFSLTKSVAVELTRPEHFSLRQNYPNPFNPETTISYDLPEDAEVSIVIYNLSGQAIRKLVNGQQSSGSHSILWNGKDDNGVQVASGVYLYKMITNNGFSQVRKLTLLK